MDKLFKLKQNDDLNEIVEMSADSEEEEVVEQQQEQVEPIKASKPANDDTMKRIEELSKIGSSTDKRQLILKINNYCSHPRIGELLKGHKANKANLEKLSVSELENMLSDVKICVSAKNSSSFVLTGFDMASSTYEHVLCNYTPYNITGFSSIINSRHPNIQLALDEIQLEYTNFTHVKPELRLMSIILMATVELSNKNDQVNSLKIDNATANKYNDL